MSANGSAVGDRFTRNANGTVTILTGRHAGTYTNMELERLHDRLRLEQRWIDDEAAATVLEDGKLVFSVNGDLYFRYLGDLYLAVWDSYTDDTRTVYRLSGA